ncbi:hypothetical protein Daesc_007194 [Daldinia eschscholtzii]|uniref:Uncharacterized protein n=1 Tax=Daldinia eschscholtzii TaxID=292717 RepID=A0AAX6MDE7_9PEZI
MSGSPADPSLRESQQRASDTMMDDLGNGRLEELARDGDEGQRPNRQPVRISRNALLAQPSKSPLADGEVTKWNDAVHEGVFEDSDYHAVKDLDSLDDGNAHRLKCATTTVEHEGGGNVSSYKNRHLNSHSKSNTPKYDPLNPGYIKKPKQPSQPLQPGYREASLGGILPPGAEVKRWDPKSRGQPGNLTGSATQPKIPNTRRDTSTQEKPQRPVTLRLENTALTQEKWLAKPTANIPNQGSQALVASKDLIPAKTFEPDQAIFKEKEVRITHAFGLEELIPGKVSVYKLPQNDIVIWHLRMSNGKSTKGDIRLCLPPFQTGCRVYLRRQDDEISEVRSTFVEFDSIPIANDFHKVVRNHRAQQLQYSQEPIFREVTETSSVAGLQPNVDKNPEQTEGRIPKNQVPQTYPTRVDTPVPISSASTQGVEIANEDLIDLSSPESLKGCGDLIDLTANAKPIANSTGVPKSANIQIGPLITMPSEDIPLTIARSQTMSPSVMTQHSLNSNMATALSTSQLEQDVTTIEEIRAGVDMSQDSLRVLSFPTMRDYKRMFKVRRSLADFFMWAQDSSPILAAKLAAMQVAVTQLKRYEEFGDLSQDEQQKAIAVVYTNVMHGNARIIHSIDNMIMLRQRACPCPNRVHRFNDFFFRMTESLKSQSSFIDSHDSVSDTSRSIARHAADERSIPGRQWSAAEERHVETEEQTRGPTEKTNTFLALLRNYKKEATEPARADANAPADTMSNSSASTLRAGAVLVPRANLMQEVDAFPERISVVDGLSASRWANHVESHHNTPTRSHGRTATGDLGSLSGTTGQLATLELDDMQRP